LGGDWIGLVRNGMSLRRRSSDLPGLSSIKRMRGAAPYIRGHRRECAGLEDEVKNDLIVNKDSEL